MGFGLELLWAGGFEKTSDESFCQKTVDEAQKDLRGSAGRAPRVEIKQAGRTKWELMTQGCLEGRDNTDLYDSQSHHMVVS